MVRITTIAIVMALALLSAMLWVSTLPERRVAGPNLVLIVLDTVRYDRTSLGRSDRDTTPYLRELAARGVTFTSARSPAEWTLPAHASLFTGLLPSEHGAHFEHRYLPDEVMTIAERLRRSDYRTGAFSSNVNVSRAFHFDQGFEAFFEAFAADDVREGKLSKSVAVEHALRDWLGTKRDVPSFVFVNLMEAHLPYDASAEHLAAFGGAASLDLQEIGAGDFLDRVVAGERPVDDAFRAALSNRYDAALRTLDDSLRRVIDVLEKAHVLDDAIVFITSDHGEHLGENGLVDHHGALSEALLHVPLVVFGTGVQSGVVRTEPIGTEIIGSRLEAFSIGGSKAEKWAMRRPFIAERYPAIEIAQRMARQRPQADRSRFETGERAVLSLNGRFKWTVTTDGREHLFELGATARDEREIALELQPQVVADLRTALDHVLERRDIVREKFIPDDVDPEAAESAAALLAQTGYGSGAAPRDTSLHAQIHLERGNRALTGGAPRDAITEYDGAIQLDPKFAAAYFNRAIALEKSGASEKDQRAAWEKYIDIATRHTPSDTQSLSQAYAKLAALPG